MVSARHSGESIIPSNLLGKSVIQIDFELLIIGHFRHFFFIFSKIITDYIHLAEIGFAHLKKLIDVKFVELN